MATNEKLRIPDIADLEMLTPGSVWIRKEGKQSRFLFLTNSTLPAAMQKNYPQAAVYADENDNIFSVPVAEFISKRTFFNVSPELENRLENLLAFDTKADNSEFDLLNADADDDSLLVEDTEDGDETGGQPSDDDYEEKADVAPDATMNMFPVSFFAGDTGLPEIISPQLLSECAECYQQTPQVAAKTLLHTLFIRDAKGITRDGLMASFNPANVELNAVYSFKVQTAEGIIDIDWDIFVGVFPYVFQNQPMYQVVFQTDVDFDYASAEDTIDVNVNLNVTSSTAAVANQMIGAPAAEVDEPSPIKQTDDGMWQVVDNTLAVSAA